MRAINQSSVKAKELISRRLDPHNAIIREIEALFKQLAQYIQRKCQDACSSKVMSYLRKFTQCGVATLRGHLEAIMEEESPKLKFDLIEEETLMNELDVDKAKDEKLPSKTQSLEEVEVGIELPIQEKEGYTQNKRAKKKRASSFCNLLYSKPPPPSPPTLKSSIIGCSEVKIVTYGKPQEFRGMEASMENRGQIEILNSCGVVDEEGKYIMVSIEKMVEKSCICGNELLENRVESSKENTYKLNLLVSQMMLSKTLQVFLMGRLRLKVKNKMSG